MSDYPADAFTLFSNLNRSKPDDKADYWAKSEWPIEEIKKLYMYATDPNTKIVKGIRGDECIVVTQNLYPMTSKESGNAYYLSVVREAKEKKSEGLPF